jgi:hypothetical protein
MTTEKKSKEKKKEVSQEEKPEIKVDIKKWVDELYSTTISDSDLKSIYEMMKFIGFDRDEVLKQLHDIFKNDFGLIQEVIIATALRGPVASNSLKLSNGRTISSYGILANGGRRSKTLTCGKITAATADLAATYLKRLNVPKRIMSSSCPAWLQFPSAGSITMPNDFRQQQYEFSKEFSKLIDKRPPPSGGFNQQIYDQMTINSYCDSKLQNYLFGT